MYCMANPCNGGQIWDNAAKACICPGDKVLVNGVCVAPQISCVNGQIWDRRLGVCTCP
jgi:hypothetical protein